MLRYHDNRRMGSGTTGDPITRYGKLCAVEHCPEPARYPKIGAMEVVIGYCEPHYEQAVKLFPAKA